ncbi:MAG: CHAD domain-containing protein [Acidobacteria bacterium]|nr:CHAD domain-containing protein [Acidobacteriota bacterium]
MDMRAHAVERASALLAGLEAQVERAAKAPGPNTIHDLRVAIRRFSQCLRVFGPLFAGRRAKRIRRRLRRVMALAGEIRSRDIAVKLWKRASQPGEAAWVAKIEGDRKRAGEKLRKRLGRWCDRDFARRWQKVWARARTGAAIASPDLAGLLTDYMEAGADLLDGQPSAKALHKFRLATKRVRYTLELFRPCCGPGLEQRLQVLRRIQQYLGEINDYATTRGLVPGKKAAAFTQFLDARASTRTADLVRYLRGPLLAPERRRWWTGYLRRIEKLRK